MHNLTGQSLTTWLSHRQTADHDKYCKSNYLKLVRGNVSTAQWENTGRVSGAQMREMKVQGSGEANSWFQQGKPYERLFSLKSTPCTVTLCREPDLSSLNLSPWLWIMTVLPTYCLFLEISRLFCSVPSGSLLELLPYSGR